MNKKQQNKKYPPEKTDEFDDSYWENWMTPLRHNHKTHYLKLESPTSYVNLKIFVRYVTGDFLEVKGENDEEWLRIGREIPFERMKYWLDVFDGDFVKKGDVEF